MVSALHDAGLEVILDVVYNHTGEGGRGPTLAFRGIDHLGYYQLTDDVSVTITTSLAAATRLTLLNPVCSGWCSTRSVIGSPRWEWTDSASTW